jgi:DAK2 domain fusion protein YloV
VLDVLDAVAVRRWCAAGLDGLRRHQQEIDDLNVYPVPDSDTGTNLVLTLTAAHKALTDEPAELDIALRRLAKGALLGAQGNSGTIIAQILRGIADALAGVVVADGRALAMALAEAARAARAVVDKPVEGTVLSVADGAARAAREVDSGELAEVVRAAARGAAEALVRTPDQLPALARAGVVDAGGRGLCVLLNALVEVVTGVAPVILPSHPTRPPVRETGSSDYAYEVQYLLDAPSVDALRVTLAELGDSLVIVDAGDGTWNVHVHVNDVGAAIEAGIVAGRPHRIAVTRFADQAASASAEAPAPASTLATEPASALAAGPAEVQAPASAEGPPPSAPPARGAVVVVSGEPLTGVFRREGAVTVPGPRPSVAELGAAIRATGAGEVVLLPNSRTIQAAAGSAADEARVQGVRVGVVPTRSPVQAMAALAVRDPARRFEDDLIAMAEAAGACRYAEVTFATADAVTVAGVARPGDAVALVEGEVNVIGAELVPTCRELLDRLLSAGGELVTLVIGADAPGDLGGLMRDYLVQRWPFVEVQVLHGGQPRYPLVVGVE